ncbi:hypothetical protein SFRURICE_001887, partial [Spodoptera frugiperda]
MIWFVSVDAVVYVFIQDKLKSVACDAYGVVFWGQSTNREFVFKLQKRCIRAIYGIKKTDSCVPYFKKSKILTLPALYILETAIFVKNNLNLFKKMADVKKIPIRSQYLNTL